MKQTIKMLILLVGKKIFNNKRSKVIYYHDLHSDTKLTGMSTSLSLFDEHINLIFKNGFKIVNDIETEDGQIKICFDDGFKGIYYHKDYIIRNNIFVEIFLVSDFIGQEGFMSENEILELNSFENFTFGCHTKTHQNLGDLSDESIFKELTLSKQKLETIFNSNIDSLCFPRGVFSKKVIDIATELGYTKLYSSIPGRYFCEDNKSKTINRCLVQHASQTEFTHTLFGAQEIYKTYRTKQHFRK